MIECNFRINRGKNMSKVKKFWDEKFSTTESLYGTQVNEYVALKSSLLKENSKVLCLGEGEGRNALFLAKSGHEVSAIDISPEALKKAEAILSENNYTIDLKVQDLITWKPKEELYDAVIVTYLHMPKNDFAKVFKSTIKSLKKGALVIGEFFSEKQLEYTSGGPQALEMLYTFESINASLQDETTEILELEETIVHLNEGVGHQGEASVIRVVAKKL